jgi:glucosylglycerate phosphorylase
VPGALERDIEVRLRGHLRFLYGGRGDTVLGQLLARLGRFRPRARAAEGQKLSERTAVLVTYADQVTQPGIAPLYTLTQTLEETVTGLISHVHVLPFMPSSSDAGFAIMDFDRVDPAFGVWGDLRRLTRRFGLMADLVMNHVSVKSEWFQRFLAGDPDYADAFITVEGNADLSAVVRPRARPLLTAFQTAVGRQQVWTTFSPDQVDLNYADPQVLLRMVDVLLSLVRRGAGLVRLDAVAFLWKCIGTPCIHLAQTHRIVKLLRAVLDAVAPDVLLVTETNVPHAENVSYFGDGRDEAQLVYQFPLPPLVVDAFLREDGTALTDWAASLERPPGDCSFLNFLASHDGIGLRPLEGLVDRSRVEALVAETLERGGRVSYRNRSDGTRSPYELNISLFDALSSPKGDEPLDRQIDRFLTAQAIFLCLAGVPAIYVHSLFGSRSWVEGMATVGESRAINREKFDRAELLSALSDETSLRARVFSGYARLLRVRTSHPAFHPAGVQEILRAGNAIFAVRRGGRRDGDVLCLHNLGTSGQRIALPEGVPSWTDLLSGKRVTVNGDGELLLAPLQTVWLGEDA